MSDNGFLDDLKEKIRQQIRANYKEHAEIAEKRFTAFFSRATGPVAPDQTFRDGVQTLMADTQITPENFWKAYFQLPFLFLYSMYGTEQIDAKLLQLKQHLQKLIKENSL